MNPMVEVGNVSDWKVFAVKDDGTRVPVRHLFVDISVLDGHTKFTETHDLTTATHADDGIGWTCYVEQGHYGHMSRKPTWLYAVRCDLPVLNWTKGKQRLHPVALERYGYERARRIGMTAMVGGKDKTKIRNATPQEFRDVLIAMARSVSIC